MADLRAPTEPDTNGLGPIAQALLQRDSMLRDLEREIAADLDALVRPL